MRFFNTAGPSVPEDHFTVDPLSRIDLSGLRALIDRKQYFLLHAPRQTGKTTVLLALMERLNHEGRYRALYANIETAQAARNNIHDGMIAVVQALGISATLHWDRVAAVEEVGALIREGSPTGWLRQLLERWALADPSRPIVLLLDEVDALVGDTLISLLRQLRAGYPQRPGAFPQSVVLCGVRDLRDYRIQSSAGEILTGGSAFNIKAESLRLGDLTREEIAILYGQYTAESGHVVGPEVIDRVWHLTRGQPWLVNALAREAFERARPDRTRPATVDDIEAAKERLILRRETHLDQLTFRLQEERVRRVIEPILAGNDDPGTLRPDDLEYLIDLGLIRRETSGRVAIANALYQEVIPRELVWATQSAISPKETPWYVRSDGRLDLPRLLTEFQDYYRRHSEHWLAGWDYKEAGPQLLLQAWLQRIVNGGGRIEREYGLGRGRTDLYLEWHLPDGSKQIAVIELKLQRGTREATLHEALPQVLAYADRCAAGELHLLLFDVRPGQAWADRIRCDVVAHDGRPVTVWGL